MANADRKHHGAGLQGKGDGTGAMTEMPDTPLRAPVLSNRDTKQHSDARGLDGKAVQTEQLEDHVMNRLTDEGEDA
jgi:hypothetical protein